MYLEPIYIYSESIFGFFSVIYLKMQFDIRKPPSLSDIKYVVNSLKLGGLHIQNTFS